MENGWAHIDAAAHEVFARRDAWLAAHCDRVGMLAMALAREYRLSGREQVVLAAAARLHDIGKVEIPEAVRRKRGPLDECEWTLMQSHSERGERIVRADLSLPWREDIALIIRHHHENHDGSGYPDGLRGDAIPLLARILSVADSYGAITEARPYHPAQTHKQAMSILIAESGRKYDPEIIARVSSFAETWFVSMDGPVWFSG